MTQTHEASFDRARLRALRAVLIAFLSSALIVAGLSAPASAHGSKSSIASDAFVPLTGSAPAGLSRVGVASMSPTKAEERQPLTITITLRRTDEAGFQRFLADVQNPKSPRYRHFLTQAQLAQRFGPSKQSYEEVAGWLQEQGLTVTDGSVNRLTLTAKGTRARAEHAFHVEIDDYRADGRLVHANSRPPSVPRQLAPAFQSVDGLSNLARPAAGPAFAKLPPKIASACSAAYDDVVDFLLETGFILLVAVLLSSLLITALAPDTFVVGGMNAYGLGTLPSTAQSMYDIAVCVNVMSSNGNWVNSGKGGGTPPHPSGVRSEASSGVAAPAANDQKIGFLEYDTYRPSDVKNWFDILGLPDSVKSTLVNQLSEVPVDGGVAAPGPDQSEVLVDVDTAMSAAPSPTTKYVVYDAPPSTSFETLFNAMIGDGDTVISNSWSQCEDQTSLTDAQAIDSILAQAAASGITVLNGTGDHGSSCLDGSPSTVGVPADSPNATAVGGTSPRLGQFYTYAGETWWGDPSQGSSSGQGGFGVSKYFARPSRQDGLSSAAGRSVPDVSLDADPAAGIAICESDAGGCLGNALYGGTSMATPELAALVAHLNEQLGSNVGDLGSALYPQGGTDSFHAIGGSDGDFSHVGLGSPNFVNILGRLTGTPTGAVSATQSTAAGMASYSDGTTDGLVRVRLEDANGNPVSGKSVTLTPVGAGNAAFVSPAPVITDPTDGSVVFNVTDDVAQTVSFMARDTTDNVAVDAQPSVTFLPPPAVSGSVVASPGIVANDGVAQASVSVYLENGLGQPAAGKTVSLSQGGSAVITPAGASSPGTTAVTDATGTATFTATDTAQESVQFAATDASDGDLSVPGSAIVSFQAQAAPVCVSTPPNPANGVSVSTFVSGLPNNQQSLVTNVGGLTFTTPPCSGVAQPAFDASGTAFVPDALTGQIYTFGPAGGVAGPGTVLPGTTPSLGGLVFDKNGELFSGLGSTGGNFHLPQLVQLDPSTGQVERVVATTANGMSPCPEFTAVDPLSGDVFAGDDCGGSLENDSVSRIANPESANPTVSTYANLGGVPTGITFAPDGTLYVVLIDSGAIVAVSGTNTPTPTVTTVATSPNGGPFGIAVVGVDAQGHATALDVTDAGGNITRVNLTNPVTTSPVATSAPTGTLRSAVNGPDGCLYVAENGLVLKVGGACGGPKNTGAQLALSGPAGTTPPAGSPVTLTAKLTNVPNPAGTPIVFSVAGANPQIKLVNADATGVATFTYSALHPGTDTVVASATVAAVAVTSNSVGFRWVAGKDTSFVSLNGSQEIGPVGQAATITASLADISQDPPGPVSGATIQVHVGTQSCTITTNTTGTGTCQVTPTSPGLLPVTATYAGNGSLTASSATDSFFAGGPSTTPPTLRATKTTLVSSVNPSVVGQSVTFTATVVPTSGTGTPTGTVVFKVDGTAQPAVTLTGAIAKFTTASLSSGPHSISATYSGDSTFAAAAVVSVTQQVNATRRASKTSVASSLNPSVHGQSVTFTLTVAPATGTGTPTGTVTLIIDDVASQPHVLALTNGVAKFSIASLTAGAHKIGASYNGDSTFAESAAATLVQHVNAFGAPAKIVIGARTSPQSAKVGTAFATGLWVKVTDAFGNAVQGASVTLKAPTTGASGKFANGTVTLTTKTNVNGVTGAAKFTANTTVGGPYSVTATVGALSTHFALTNTAKKPTTSSALGVRRDHDHGPVRRLV